MRGRYAFSPRWLVSALTVLASIDYSVGAVLGNRNGDIAPRTAMSHPSKPPGGDFPVCTRTDNPTPFCLPRDGADVIVDGTYYVTWNADFYPLNSTVTIELRYPASSNGQSAFTSEKTDNSYGYIPLHMRKEWLQGQAKNTLSLYIVELDPASGRRASVRKGPTITLHKKPVQHYAPPPPLPFNRKALIIGLPVSLGVVLLIVIGLFFGMRESRRVALKKVMTSRGKGYGIGKSKSERMKSNDKPETRGPGGPAALKKYSEDADEGLSEIDPDQYNEVERRASHAFSSDMSRLKSWGL